MIKVTRLTNATRDKTRPPLLGTLPNAALLARIPQVRKNKPARKAGDSPIQVKPASNGHTADRANALNAPATWRKTTPQPARPQQPPNGSKRLSPQPPAGNFPPVAGQKFPEKPAPPTGSTAPDEKKPVQGHSANGKKPSEAAEILPRANQPVEKKPDQTSQHPEKSSNPSSIRSSRLTPGPNRNKLFMDRSVPDVRSVPDRSTPDRLDPARPSPRLANGPDQPEAGAQKSVLDSGNARVPQPPPAQNTPERAISSPPSAPTSQDRKTPSTPPAPTTSDQITSSTPPAPTSQDRKTPSTPPAPTTQDRGISSTPPAPTTQDRGISSPPHALPKVSSSQAVPAVPERASHAQPPLAKVAPKPAPEPAPKETAHTRALEQLLARHPDLPAQTAVLGVCDDGLPVLFDLLDPAPGAMAIIGDEREAQLEILRTVISSTAMRNTPRGAQFLILSIQPETWQRWIAERGYERYCLAITDVSDESVREWTLRMADWTEQRRLGQSSGPPVLMIMDTLSFLPKMAYDVRLNFDWMAKEGPPAAIWPLAAISSELALSLGSRMLRGFQSRILGYANDPSAYTQLANVSEEQAANLRSPGSFAVQVGESWLCFHLPEEK